MWPNFLLEIITLAREFKGPFPSCYKGISCQNLVLILLSIFSLNICDSVPPRRAGARFGQYPPTARSATTGAREGCQIFAGNERTNGSNLECGSHKMDLLRKPPRFPHCPPYKLSLVQRLIKHSMYIWRLVLDKFAYVGVFFLFMSIIVNWVQGWCEQWVPAQTVFSCKPCFSAFKNSCFRIVTYTVLG